MPRCSKEAALVILIHVVVRILVHVLIHVVVGVIGQILETHIKDLAEELPGILRASLNKAFQCLA